MIAAYTNMCIVKPLHLITHVMTEYNSQFTERSDFSLIEEQILEFWKKNNIFKKSVENRDERRRFVFYDGPPFANGLPHYGHLLTGFIKDTVARYKTMAGFRVDRRFGWDCHGLPAEMLAEKELGISGKLAIEKFGVKKFNEHCCDSVMRFSIEWKQYVDRQLRWVDFENDYKTMNLSFMESVMWSFYQLWQKGLIYESIKIVPYSWACQTPLSNFETRMDNAYRQKTSKTVTLSFELLDKPKLLTIDNVTTYKMLVWTTTPWTLPCNLALAISPNIKYCGAIINKEMYIFSRVYMQNFENHCKKNNIEYLVYNSDIYYSNLESLSYKPVFDYFVGTKNAFKILVADFVVEDEGTGIVHMAPGFGEDDFILCQKLGIPDIDDKDTSKLLSIICPIDDAGKFTDRISDFVNMHVFDTNDQVISILKGKNLCFKTEQYLHNYPHCWRTDTPLIYRAMSSWYVEVTKIKNRMIDLNKTVNWIPNHIRTGQFGKWLENAKDWAISRNRFWGTPLPVWKSDNPNYPRIDVYGSIKKVFDNVKALEEDFDIPIDDLHRPYIDNLVRPNPDDPTGQSMMRRVTDVFDCWFESGSMPYAQLHYPFENKEFFENYFPRLYYRICSSN